MSRTMKAEAAVIYQPVPSIRYVIEADHIRLVDEQQGLSWMLKGTEAILWDLLVSGYSYQKIVVFISLLPSLSEADAEITVLTTLGNWVNQGILQTS